ncbi:hypothetical protein E4U42_004963 [Claviceps africana]|uniref:Uncharacterized protein n=1 Tax=Claviceps africana TaxID=83212 RepID=A0A8K0J4D3_9HYPO|nr:hypothetical protein E4U42_004963 [Claviceps africana]
MRPCPTRNGLILAALLASCGQLVLGAPTAPTADIDPWFETSTTSPGLAGALKARRREEDASVLDPEESGFQGLDARSFPPRIPGIPGKPSIPPPPPPRGPRTGPGNGIPRPVPRPAQPRPRPVTPPRPHPPPPAPVAHPIPAGTNPNKGPGLGNEPKPMSYYEKEGTAKLNMYQERIRSRAPDTLIVETEAEVAKHPKFAAFLDINKNNELDLVKQDVRLDDSQELKMLKEFTSAELGFSMKDIRNLRQISVHPIRNHMVLINRGTYDADGKIILYQDAFNANNIGQGAKRIPLNEMGMQNFKSVAGDKTKNLRAVFLMNVQNKEFWGITRECYNARGQPFSEVLTFERGTAEFNRFMGSPSFSSKFLSFANHHNAIDNKVPQRVIVMPEQHANSGGKLTVAVVF